MIWLGRQRHSSARSNLSPRKIAPTSHTAAFGQLDTGVRLLQRRCARWSVAAFYPPQKIAVFTLLPFSSFLHEPSPHPGTNPIQSASAYDTQTRKQKKAEQVISNQTNCESRTIVCLFLSKDQTNQYDVKFIFSCQKWLQLFFLPHTEWLIWHAWTNNRMHGGGYWVIAVTKNLTLLKAMSNVFGKKFQITWFSPIDYV